MNITKLAEYGESITITIPWAKLFLKSMNFMKRREEVKETFLTEILETVKSNNVPQELNINWDQTGVNLAPTVLLAMDKKNPDGRVSRQLSNNYHHLWESCGEVFPFHSV